MLKPSVIITIDPGIRGMGIAVWDVEDWNVGLLPLATYVVTPPADDNWVFAIADLHVQLTEIFDKYVIIKSYCEFPQYFTSGVGHAATAGGNIYKLACLIGVIMGMMLDRKTICYPIKVNDWKGQLSKDAVIARLVKREPRLKDMKINTHAWDAVGIGFHLKKKLNVQMKDKR